jgi:squalene-hopene/tetraprenyl-beta-curcumene cyclase
MRRLLLALVCSGLGASAASAAAPLAGKGADFPPPAPTSAKAPMAKAFSLAKGAEHLDRAAVNWTRRHKCASCHTNVPYLMARPALKEKSRGEEIVRTFFEGQVAGWESGEKKAQPRGDAYVVIVAVALAFHDAQTTGKLQPMTRKALDRMWLRQKPHGAWDWIKCGWAPLEYDDYFGAVLAAVGVGVAPDDYATTDKAKVGLPRLKAYLKKVPAPTLHHKAWLMWASTRLDGLMTRAEREQTIKDLLALQRPDGGWCLPSLGDWRGADGRKSNPKAPSDGYGTGLVVYLLRQAGLPAKHPAVTKGVAWLKANQREPGLWFTQSLNTDRTHYISDAGSAFALLALKACE